jgi:hypothetical protein
LDRPAGQRRKSIKIAVGAALHLDLAQARHALRRQSAPGAERASSSQFDACTPIETHVTAFPLVAANEALAALCDGQLTSATVLVP